MGWHKEASLVAPPPTTFSDGGSLNGTHFRSTFRAFIGTIRGMRRRWVFTRR